MRLEEAIRSTFDVAQEIGDELLVHCPDPDHDDRNPSASINVKKGLWICYSCGAGGHVDQLLDGVQVSEDIHTEDLVAELEKAVDSLQDTSAYLPERWLDQFLGPPHPYWLGRGLTPQTIAEFQLGYDPAFQPDWRIPPVEMVTMPLRAPNGGLLGVVHRRLDNAKPKYHYPGHADVSQCLFAYERVREGIDHVVLTEGALNAIALWQEGIPALAQYGDRLREPQAALLRRLDPLSITLAYDADDAGRKSAHWTLWGEDRYDKRGRHKGYKPPPDLGPVTLRVASWEPEEGNDILDLTPDRRVEVIMQADMRT